MIIEVILLNLIYILFPIFCYLIYITYQKTVGKKINNLFFDFGLLSSIYLVLKYGAFENNLYNVMILNLVLIIAFCKNRYIISMLLSIYLVWYYYDVHSYNLILLIIEYLSFIYLYVFRKNKNNINVIYTFNLINIMFNIVFILTVDNNLNYIYVLAYNILFAIISYLVVTLIDNSESVIELNGTIKRLEKEKLLRNSLFKITHEIKNPIAVCKGYLDMMDTNNTKQVNRYVPIIKQEINRTLTLMTDFLSLTKLKINKSELDITALLEDVCYDIETLLNMNSIDFEYQIPDKEIYIEGDYDRLKQVLVNLIKNSIESIEQNKKGNIKLFVTAEKKCIKIIIKDNGVGMNEETLKRIGEAFFTTKSNGTGLGIKLSKEIIEGHDGEILYNSKLDKGTTATIKLPIKIST